MCTEKQLVALQPCLLPSRTSDLHQMDKKCDEFNATNILFHSLERERSLLFIYLLFFSGEPKHLVNYYFKLP